MTASFDFEGKQIERYYHFICKSHTSYISLLYELGLQDKLCWRESKMGFYYAGKLYSWGDPLSLLRFPALGMISKVRYAVHVLYCKYTRQWKKLDDESGVSWIKRWIGEKAYHILWERLLYLKFYHKMDKVSAAWMASRIQCFATTRRNMFVEELGFLQGGSETLLASLQKYIEDKGGEILLNSPVNSVVTEGGKITAIESRGGMWSCDQVISTIPLPYIPSIVPDIAEDIRQKIHSIENIGVACVIMRLSRPVSRYFWMNINDEAIEIPGVIEYSNLYPMDENIVYFPYYLPHDHAKYRFSDEQFIAEVTGYLHRLNPEFDTSWIIASHVSRYHYAQTVCHTGFFDSIPPIETNIEGFLMADTSYYYPEDRCISESVAMGRKLAEMAHNKAC